MYKAGFLHIPDSRYCFATECIDAKGMNQRFFSRIGQSKDKLLAATALLMTFVGLPCLYYGTELAMEGDYDPDCRKCFNWNEKEWDRDFHEQMRDPLTLRQEKVIQEGAVQISNYGNLLQVTRMLDNRALTLVINLGPACAVKVENIKQFHRLTDDQLLTNGFVIYEKERKD